MRASHIVALLCVTGVMSLCKTADASGQVLRGKVAVVDIGEPIENAAVFLRGFAGEVYEVALTDSLGLFALRGPGPGTYYLSVHKLGYEPVESDAYDLNRGTVVDVRVNMKHDVFMVKGITVYGRRMTWGQAEFQVRREKMDTSRFYHDFDAQDIEKGHFSSVADLMGTAGFIRPTKCMIVWLDGWESNLGESYPIHWVYGVEVFTLSRLVPWKYRKYHPQCGAILIWTTTIGAGGLLPP